MTIGLLMGPIVASTPDNVLAKESQAEDAQLAGIAVPPDSNPGNENWSSGFHSPGMGGYVYALAFDSHGNLYAGGEFINAGNCNYAIGCHFIAKWDGAKWNPLGNGMGSAVRALAVDSNDNLYAAGSFTNAGNCDHEDGCISIAKWDGSNWLPLGTGIWGPVSAMAFDSAGNLYVGGGFLQAGGVSANNIAKWDGSNWSALGSGLDYGVSALAVDSSGNLYAGGGFTSAGSCTTNCNYIARWDGSSWGPVGTGMDDSVHTLAFDSSGNLYAGGEFINAGSCTTDCKYIARWDGTNWSALGTGMSYTVYTLAFDSSGTLYAGGKFGSAGSCAVGCGSIAQWNGTDWVTVGSGVSEYVYALVIDSSDVLYVGGEFTSAGSESANYIAKWDGANWDGNWPAGHGISGLVEALAVDSSGNPYAGGDFEIAGACATCSNIAHWNGTGWEPLGDGVNDTVYALAVDSSGNLYAGGDFTSAGNHIARWNGTTWGPLGSGINGAVYALAFDSHGDLYAGGYFSDAGSCTTDCQYVARWDGTNWNPLGTGMNNTVYALAFDSHDNLYAGGEFNSAGSCNSAAGCNRVARWDSTTSTWGPLGVGTNEFVHALVIDDNDKLYAGGWFTSAGSCTSNCNYIARWNGTGWEALETGMSFPVRTLTFDSSANLYAGGDFHEAGSCIYSKGCNSIAKWDGTTWGPLGTGTNGHDSNVHALAFRDNGDLYVGGEFTGAGNQGASHIARWTAAVAQCDLAESGDYTLYADNLPVNIHINTLGTLGCISVQRFNKSHPKAGAYQMSGYYWSIRGTNSSGGQASGFDLNLTLPYASAASHNRVCRYDSLTSTWSCAANSFVAGVSVTRNNITVLSDWAIDDNLLDPISLFLPMVGN